MEDLNNKKYLAMLEVSNVIGMSLGLDDILNRSVNIIVKKLNIDSAVIFINDEKNKRIYSKTFTSKAINFLTTSIIGKKFDLLYVKYSDINNLITQTILEKKIFQSDKLSEYMCPVVNLSTANIIQKISRTKNIISIPVIHNEHCLGAIMFTKTNNTGFDEDLDLLKIYSQQIAISINNSLLFTEKEKQIQIIQLQNRDLRSLYSLSIDISKSLDPDEVCQIAVRSIPQTDNILGSMIMLLDSTGKNLFVKAYNTNSSSDARREIVNQTYPVIPNYYSTEVINGIQPIFSDSIKDNTKLPELIIKFIENHNKITTIAEFPIVSRSKVIGTIVYFLQNVSAGTIAENLKQLLNTYRLQIGIALENAILYSDSQIMQKKLQIAIDDLQEARRRERDMIDVMGHELRTPLSIVRNALMVMDRDAKNLGVIAPEKLKKYLDMAVESVRREVDLVETLLAATKIDSNRIQLNLTKCDMVDVVNDSIEGNQRNSFQKEIEIIFNKPTTDYFAYADRTRTQEIMDNLLSNALKYTAKGTITIDMSQDSEYVTIIITDTGIGIKEEDLLRLGKKFFRATQMVSDNANGVHPGGTGLGLYVAFKLIDYMKGKKEIKSQLGVGSSFSFSLPVYTDQKDFTEDQASEGK